jgi:hypothetical protein
MNLGGWGMAGPYLYSVNPKLKFDLCAEYYGGKHFVWCADCFDGRGGPLHNGGAYPASSNPAELFAALKAATGARRDWHNLSIQQWKLDLKQRATDDLTAGRLTDDQAKEIIFRVDKAEFTDFRPLLYVINRAMVEKRLKEVNIADRASPPVIEYQLVDLVATEFDAIELP